MGTFTATLLVVFREVLEAGLMVGIVLTVLTRLHSLQFRTPVFWGAAAAVGLSFAIAFGLHQVVRGVSGTLEIWLQGMVSFSACGVLTYMVFWIDGQCRRVHPDIERRVERAVSRGQYLTMVIIPFVAVLREGMETVLFLHAVAIQHSHAVSWWGGILGASAALAITGLIFIGGKKIPLLVFFRITGFFLLFVAAGLVTHGIHEFQKLGPLPLSQTAWNTSFVLSERAGLGSFLKSLLGYNAHPSILEVIVYGAYLLAISFFLKTRSRPVTVETVP